MQGRPCRKKGARGLSQYLTLSKKSVYGRVHGSSSGWLSHVQKGGSYIMYEEMVKGALQGLEFRRA